MTPSTRDSHSFMTSAAMIMGRLADAIDRLDQLSVYLASAGLAAMSGIVVVEVVLRSLFSRSTLIADEMASYFLAMLSFFAMGYALRTEGHIRIELLFERLPSIVRKWAEVVFAVIGIVSLSFFTHWLTKMTIQTYVIKETSMSQLDTPMWIPRSVLVYGTVVLILALVSRLIRLLRNELKP